MTNFIQEPSEIRKRVQSFHYIDEKSYIRYLTEKVELLPEVSNRICIIARQIIEKIKHNKLGVIESLLQQYSLSSDEGVALMCLAESLLRVPDSYTVDELIKDKIVDQGWKKHLGSSSLFVNAYTWGLIMGSDILKDQKECSRFQNIISKLLKNLGEPLIRNIVKHAVSMLGKHFVIGHTIEEALEYTKLDENSKFSYSYDMLGEAARTCEDAEKYFNSYMHAIKVIGYSTTTTDNLKSHGISIKLSALHPRYEFGQFDLVAKEIFSKVLMLCHEAKKHNISLCIDAEESERLEISLILFELLRLDQSLSGWEGLGIAVQAYQKRALSVLDFIEDVSIRSQHKIMVRLVKGAYWDSEIKRAQEMGLSSYPVFTRKSYTDVSYLACAQKLLAKVNNFYPCFATHNAYTFSAIIELADKDHPGFEFQRLYGMGKDLYEYAMTELTTNINCCVYGPVGSYNNLLSYLIRRLLENGANSSFIHKIHDKNVSIEDLICNPLEKAKNFNYEPHPSIPLPKDILGTERINSLGMDINDSTTILQFRDYVKFFNEKKWQVGPIISGELLFDNNNFVKITNPALLGHIVGEVSYTIDNQAIGALESAHEVFHKWQNTDVEERAKILEKAADLIEEKRQKLIYLLIVEAGKILSDAVAEIREAVDFLRY
uniref:bifunctional proline dehydrogenase/L-glutamate gamma-semialdehyde dehydrogenase PutA n=1 Tax=Wolbachia endosymbiont of Pentidionis agamae TaxID=3110435 RepID=UPI002FD21056